MNSQLSFDYGARVEHQKLADEPAHRAPRGFAWTPSASAPYFAPAGASSTTIPLDVYTFGRYPERTVTFYNPDGSIIGDPIDYVNVIGSVTGTAVVSGARTTGHRGFAPRGSTYNARWSTGFPVLLHVRATYSDNRSVGLITSSSRTCSAPPTKSC